MEDYWWEVENMSMDNSFMISSSTPPPPSPNHNEPQPQSQPQIHPSPPMPLPHPKSTGGQQPNMIDQDYINPNLVNTTNMSETKPTNASKNFITVEEDNHQSNNEQNTGENEIKTPILINNENVNVMQSAILEIIHGNDVMKCLKTYAKKYQCGLTVMSGTGYVKDVTLRQLGAANGVFIKLSGKHEILAIHGGFFPEGSPHMESGLRVYFGDGHGHVIGGVVVGQLVVYGLVRVVASYFTTAILETLPLPFLVSRPPQNLPQFSGSSPASSPQPRDAFVGESSMAETSSAPPLSQGYCGVAPPCPPSSF